MPDQPVPVSLDNALMFNRQFIQPGQPASVGRVKLEMSVRPVGQTGRSDRVIAFFTIR